MAYKKPLVLAPMGRNVFISVAEYSHFLSSITVSLMLICSIVEFIDKDIFLLYDVPETNIQEPPTQPTDPSKDFFSPGALYSLQILDKVAIGK